LFTWKKSMGSWSTDVVPQSEKGRAKDNDIVDATDEKETQQDGPFFRCCQLSFHHKRRRNDTVDVRYSNQRVVNVGVSSAMKRTLLREILSIYLHQLLRRGRNLPKGLPLAISETLWRDNDAQIVEG